MVKKTKLVVGVFTAAAISSAPLAPVANALTVSKNNITLENQTLIFQSTKSQTLNLSGVNSPQKYLIKDASGKTVAQGTLKAGQSSLALKLPQGWYEITMLANSSSNTWTTSFMVAPQQPQNAKLGAQVHLSNPSWYYSAWKPSVIPLAKMLGLSSIRDDIYFRNFYTGPNLFTTPKELTNEIKIAGKNGLSFLSIAGFSGTFSPRDFTAPETPKQYTEYANQIVKFLNQNPSVKRVELWNEFNEGMGMGDEQDRSGKKYAELAKFAYPIIKRAHPDVVVIAGATAHYDAPWWKEFFENGGGKFADAYSYHPYWRSEKELTYDANAISQLSRKHTGKEKPIFISEVNWNDLENMRDTQVGSRGAADRLAITLTQSVAHPNIQHVNIYDLINDGADTSPFADYYDVKAREANYGLFRVPNTHVKGYAPKRTAFATWYLNNRIKSNTGAMKKLGYSNNGRIAIYKINKGTDVFMQADLKETNLPSITRKVYTDPNKFTKITDSMGKVIVPKGKRASTTITIGNSPLYLSTTNK